MAPRMSLSAARAWMLAIGAVVVLTPALALASATNTASDHTALIAYQLYVNSLLAGTPSANQRAEEFANMVRTGCEGVLAPLESLSAAQVSSTALQDFGVEIAGDLTLELHAQAKSAFQRLSATLASLRWSGARTARSVDTFTSALSASLAVAPSALCIDARALRDHPLRVPAGTRSFVATYLPAELAAKQALAPFLAVLERFQTRAEAGIIGSVNREVASYDSSSAADQSADSKTIVGILGLSGA